VSYGTVFNIVDDAEQCLVSLCTPLVFIDMPTDTHTVQLVPLHDYISCPATTTFKFIPQQRIITMKDTTMTLLAKWDFTNKMLIMAHINIIHIFTVTDVQQNKWLK